jgi:hypothetical protein
VIYESKNKKDVFKDLKRETTMADIQEVKELDKK